MKAEALKLKAVCIFFLKLDENYFKQAIGLLAEAQKAFEKQDVMKG